MSAPSTNPANTRRERYQAYLNGQEISFGTTLVAKYDRPGPRYTSYPTAPQWHEVIDTAAMHRVLAESNPQQRPLSLYVHIPFCEEHCTFCGCNTIITRKKTVADPYVDAVALELAHLARHLDTSRPVTQLHWGGGTPTYLTCAEIERLWGSIVAHFHCAADAEIGIEVDPRVTTPAQLETLRRLGFNRLSMGVQDLHPMVQQAIHRIQPREQTERIILAARQLGFASINVDLIYGLPHQTPGSFAETVDSIIAFSPDRVACYNFAFVPWLKAQQRAIDPSTLPPPETKLAVLCNTITRFCRAGYEMIGFDHFARHDDELSLALRERTLWRNFQGYSTKGGTDLIGCGITAISDINGHYIQNGKKLTTYQQALAAGALPVERGCHLSGDDRIRRHVIRELLCNGHLDGGRLRDQFGIELRTYFASELAALGPMMEDGLITIASDSLTLTPLGRLFARNIAMRFDAYLDRDLAQQQRYSRTV
ncbi:MAG: oxygen-independent coproporphyrinogen III oxidase [Deltaproteobacteria bacterium]|nr:oxygen-independent coproporphyrinogen III oxidase [Deltaproteobacteria bacterium]